MIPRTPHKLVITVDNVSPADAIALKKMKSSFLNLTFLAEIVSVNKIKMEIRNDFFIS